jgi:hypothetical protein
VARTYKHQEKPELEVTGVKVYKVIHRIIPPQFLQYGVAPDDPELYLPYFLGEFDKDGVMKPYHNKVTLMMPDETTVDFPRDPMLYWLVPRIRPPERNEVPVSLTNEAGGQQYIRNVLKRPIKDFLAIHAGDIDEGAAP